MHAVATHPPVPLLYLPVPPTRHRKAPLCSLHQSSTPRPRRQARLLPLGHYTPTDVRSSPGEPLVVVNAHASAMQSTAELALHLVEHVDRPEEVGVVHLSANNGPARVFLKADLGARQPTEQGGPLFRNAASTYNGYISECRGAGSVYVKYLASYLCGA